MPGPSRTALKTEAKYNVTTEFPHLGLHAAAATGNIGLVQYALTHGQPINSVLDGVLPLHAACSGGSDLVVQLLIDHGADVNAPRLPRRYSNEKHRDASAPIVGVSGSTPLHFAAANGHTTVVSTLLKNGADPDIADKYGITPETLARQNGWLECADLLRDGSLKRDKGDDPYGRITESLLLAPSLEDPSRRRLHVKRSVDHALNALKSTLNNRSESHLHRAFNSSPPPPSPPMTSKTLGTYTLYPAPPARSTDDLSRRPSLPHIYDTLPPIVKPPRSHRRPQSAGSGEDERPIPPYKLGTKYSLLNLFKRASESSSASQLAEPVLPPPSPSGDSTLPTLTQSPSHMDTYVHVASHTRIPSGSDDSSSHDSITPVSSALSSHVASRHPSVLNVIQALPVFEDDERTRTSSLPSHAAAAFPRSIPGNRVISSSHAHGQQQQPPLQQQVQSPLRESRHNSSATTVSSTGLWTSTQYHQYHHHPHSPHRLAFRSNSTPASAAKTRNLLSLRVGIAGDMSGVDMTIPELATRTQDSQPIKIHIDEEQEDEDEFKRRVMWKAEAGSGGYERPRLGTLRTSDSSGRGSSLASSSSSLSPILSADAGAVVPDLPFPLGVSVSATGPVGSHAGGGATSSSSPQPALVAGGLTAATNFGPKGQHRHRGSSISSASTDSSAGPPPPSVSETNTPLTMVTAKSSMSTSLGDDTSNGIGTIGSTPKLDSEKSADVAMRRTLEDSPRSAGSGAGLSERRAHVPLDIDIRSISSHAQAEALVHHRQQSILDMATSDNLDPPSAVAGNTSVSGGIGAARSPLSAKLLAYGESLALERKLKREEEERAAADKAEVPTMTAAIPTAQLHRSASRGSPRDIGDRLTMERQLSLERRPRRSDHRRPNMSVEGSFDIREYSPLPDRASHLQTDTFLPPHSSSRQLIQQKLHHQSDTLVNPACEADCPSASAPSPPSSPTQTLSTPPAPPAPTSGSEVIVAHSPSPGLDFVFKDSALSLSLSLPSSANVPIGAINVDVPESPSATTADERDIASASKLSRMGFATADGWQPSSTISAPWSLPPRSGSKVKFGIRSLMQSLKGKS